MRHTRYIFFIGAIFMLINCGSSADKKAEFMKEYSAVISRNIDTIDYLSALFPRSPEQMIGWSEAAMTLAQQEFKDILAIPADKRTYANTVAALDYSQSKLSTFSGLVHLASMVSPDKAMRDTGHELSTTLSKFSVDLYYTPALYKAFQAYVDGFGQQEELSSEQHYYLDESMRDFKRSGFDLPETTFEEIKKLKKELSQAENDFSLNIATSMPTITVDLADLQGVNPSMIASFKKDGDKYVLGVDYPTYFEIMEKCQIAQTRRAMYFAFNNRAYPQNDGLLKDIFKKRDSLSKLLNYKNFAHYDTDGTMAKNEERVESFLSDLAAIASKKTKKELKNLVTHLPEGVMLTDNGMLHAWDYSFIREDYKKRHFTIDESKIAEYFPVQKALDGMFSIYQQFLGLTFKQVEPGWSWHEDVQLIEIYRTENNAFLGYLMLDLYPRDNKYTHACYMPVVPSFKVNGENCPTVGVVIANFPKALGDKPALLKFSDVETFFHEFGHAMHAVLGRTELAGCSGTSVKTDFVEMPSQMFEEWMLESDMLRKVSGHYQTGESLPDDIIRKKIELKQFDSGFFVVRQCMLSFLSLRLGQANKYDIDPSAIWQELYEKYMAGMRFEPEAHQHASFGHLGAGHYASKYYSYMWSKVFALDIFHEIKRHGLLDKAIGNRLVQEVLGKGGSADPAELLHTFLKREPRQDAFLKDLGLK